MIKPFSEQTAWRKRTFFIRYKDLANSRNSINSVIGPILSTRHPAANGIAASISALDDDLHCEQLCWEIYFTS